MSSLDLVIILILMFSLTQNYLTRGFWGDEAWTSLISQLPYLQMLKTTAADFHPPGYYSVVEFVYLFLPPTEVVTRSISIVFYFLTIFMVFKLAASSSTSEESRLTSEVFRVSSRKMFGILSAIVVAVNPIFFTYAFEARNYTMFAFAATGSIFFLVKLSDYLQGDSGFSAKAHLGGGILLAASFILFTTLGIYTHYYMFFILVAEFLYILLFDRKILFAAIAAYFVVALLYLPWIPFLFGQLTSVSGNYWIGTVNGRTHYEALLRILGGEHKNAIRPWLFSLSILLLVVGLVQHMLRDLSKNKGLKFEKPYLLIWLWATVPFILATLPGFQFGGVKLPFRPIFFWRYLIGSAIPLAMVMVHSAQKFPKYLMWISIGLVIILSLAIDFLTFTSSVYGFREVYREQVISEIGPDDKIVTVLPSFAEVLYYRNRYNLDSDLIVLDEGLVQFSGKSLLDAYVVNGVVTIDGKPDSKYFEMRRGDEGPAVEVRD